jgi:hypothetical protein
MEKLKRLVRENKRETRRQEGNSSTWEISHRREGLLGIGHRGI